MHCTSGRDRTGVVVASVLLVLGVPATVVQEEYLLSDGADPTLIGQALDGLTSFQLDSAARDALMRNLGTAG